MKTEVSTPPMTAPTVTATGAGSGAAAAVAPAKKAKPARKPATPAPAATHKTTARRALKNAAPASVFDAEAYRTEIEQEAYFLWLKRGGEHGHEQEDWLSATEIVRQRITTAGAA